MNPVWLAMIKTVRIHIMGWMSLNLPPTIRCEELRCEVEEWKLDFDFLFGRVDQIVPVVHVPEPAKLGEVFGQDPFQPIAIETCLFTPQTFFGLSELFEICAGEFRFAFQTRPSS